jgi:cell division protein FtsN
MSAARSAHSGQTSALTGFVVGLLTGLILALLVALYVSRVPVPFMDRGVSRNAEADKAETERNKDWNPNAALSKGVPAPAATPSSTEGALSAPGSNDALGQLLESKTTNTNTNVAAAERFAVQAGAFAAEADAQSQRAKLVLLGVDAQVVAADQNGKTLYRVRTAAVDQRFQAEALQDQLKAAGVESSVVRVPR